MFALFTLKFWEIHDYTSRKESREWLRINIADGWWRRGLFQFVLAMTRGAITMVGFVLLVFMLARQLTVNAIPEDRMMGAAIVILFSIIVLSIVLGALGIQAAESVFVRYVSQNVSYTSVIILKRVIKAKINEGLLLCLMV
jgi:hypothetical protein